MKKISGFLLLLLLFAGFTACEPEPLYIPDIANGDGTYTVKMYLPDGTRTDVGIKATFLANETQIIQCTGKNNKPCWSTIVEKALFKYNQVFDNFNPIGGTGPVPIVAMLTVRSECVDYKPKKVKSMSADEMRAVEVTVYEIGSNAKRLSA